MHGGSRRSSGDVARANPARMRLLSSEGVYSAELSASAWSSDEMAHAPKMVGPRVTVVETASSSESGQRQVARWIAAEAMSRGFQVRLERADQLSSQPRHAADVALLMLHDLPPSSNQHEEPNLSWERWETAAQSLVEQGTTVIVVSSGAGAAAVACCLRRGAVAAVDVDDAKRALDVVQDVSRAALDADDLHSILPCPYRRDQLKRLAALTPNETRVLFHLVCGHSAEHIANAQWTSLSTVRAHIRSIFRKLGVKSQIAAVAYAHGTAAPDLRGSEEPECTR